MRERSITVLVADDDPEDTQLIKDAFKEGPFSGRMEFVKDGEELMNKLRSNAPLPALILLDLNMPKKCGREALKEIKEDAFLKQIPIVVFTTSRAEDDIATAYNFGANSYVTKPPTFSSLVDVIAGLGRYWFDIVALPKENIFPRLGLAGDRT